MKRRDFLRVGAAVMAAPYVIRNAAAETWPTRPIRLLVPYTPGGGADILARMLAKHMSESLGQKFVVENRSGANTIIGTQVILKSPADGYNYVVGTSSLAVNPFLYKTIPFDYERDLVPIALTAMIPFVLVVDPQLPVKTVPELIEHAKATKDGLIFGSYGAGSTSHLVGLLMGRIAGVKVTHVAYAGSAPVLTDLMGGRIAFAFSTILPAMPPIKDGRLRAIAVTDAARIPALSNVPTMVEAGMTEFGSALGWNSVHAPKGTPEVALRRMNKEILAALDKPEVRKFLDSQGYVSPPSDRNTPDNVVAIQHSDAGRWGPIIREEGIRLE